MFRATKERTNLHLASYFRCFLVCLPGPGFLAQFTCVRNEHFVIAIVQVMLFYIKCCLIGFGKYLHSIDNYETNLNEEQRKC